MGGETGTPAFAAARATRTDGGSAERRDGAEPSRARPADAFDLATAVFRRGERLDMQALAAELGVSRATLYRWTGDRERLLADIVWSQAEALLAWTMELPGTGGQVIGDRTHAFMQVVATAPSIRAFLRYDSELAFRVLTRSGTGVHDRSVERLAAGIERECERGYEPRLPPLALANALIRIVEGYLYGDMIAGLEPDVQGASHVIRALL